MAQSSPKILGREAFKTIVSRAITQADTNTTAEVLTIPAGSWVPPYGVSLEIVEAFAGGTPSIDIGDGSDPDGWVDTTEVTEGTLGTYTGIASGYATTGKYYASTDTIDAVVATGLTNGTAYLYVRYWDMTACDLAAWS